MHGLHLASGDWMVMLHGYAWGSYTNQSGPRGRDEAFVTFDGQAGFQLQIGDEIEVRRAEKPLRLIRSSMRSYFEVLRTKLKWGER